MSHNPPAPVVKGGWNARLTPGAHSRGRSQACLLREIIKGGPYQRKDELVQKEIPPRATYEGMKYKIVAKQQ